MAGINKHSPGCSCCGCSLTAHVVDCRGGAVSGATVTFTSGATVYTATTDGSGNATVTAAAGTWTVTASKANYLSASGSITITCPTGGTVNLTLNEGDAATSTSPIYFTAGGHTVTLPKLFGVPTWLANTTLYGTGIDDQTPNCGATVPAVITISVRLVSGCWVVGYGAPMKDRGGTLELVASGDPVNCGLLFSASMTGTVTSFSASPISGSGTFGSTWTIPPAGASYVGPPLTGPFSWSQ